MSRNFNVLREIEQGLTIQKPAGNQENIGYKWAFVESAERVKMKAIDKYEKKSGPGRKKALLDGYSLPDEIFEIYLGMKNAIHTRGAQSKVFLITSALPKEGSSTVAAEFSATLAMKCRANVLLIDGNLRFPKSSGFLGDDSNMTGLSDLLSDRFVVEQRLLNQVIIQSPQIMNLWILTAGKSIKTPLELFVTSQFSDLIGYSKTRFDYVIIDSPAVNLYPETTVMALKCDGTILVIKARSTSRQIVFQANKKLIDSEAKVLGVVLNRY